MYERRLDLALAETESCFLWGARQTGKSTLLHQRFPEAHYYDLLKSDEYRRLLDDPSILRQEVLARRDSPHSRSLVIIDEVQKIPELLDEAHWLMENCGTRFILCGSSARKLRRGHANLLGGRAIRYELFPLTAGEIPEFDLLRALNHGLLPRIYDSPHAHRLLQSYVSDYLREEVAAEALTRNVAAFSRFLDIAGISNGQTINYQNIASECGVSAPTVKEYFQIMEDTLIGSTVPAFRSNPARRVVAAPRFYLFDMGVAAYLGHRAPVEKRSTEFDRAFEHFIFTELRAHSSYSEQFYPITYWRTSTGLEVDFVLGRGTVAVEVKAKTTVTYRDLKGLRAFRDDYTPEKCVVVSLVPEPRITEDGVRILPWQHFLEALRKGEITDSLR